MTTFRKVLVGLDLTDMDTSLIRYTGRLTELMPGIKEIEFVHNIKFDYPAEAEEIMQKLDRPLTEVVTEGLEEKIEAHFRPARESAPITRVVVTNESSTPHVLADYCQEYEVDLVICGKKRNYRGSGAAMERLLRLSKFKASMLMLPESSSWEIHRILAPTDFSENSGKALRLAHRLAAEVNADVQCQHVFDIPTHYFPYIPVGDVRKSMRKEAEKSWREFIAGQEDPTLQELECTFSFTRNRSTAETVYDHALQKSIDLIVIGSRGKGGLPATLFGSVAMQLFKYDFHIPLLIVRDN